MVFQRSVTDRRVAGASCVAKKRINPDGRIVLAGGVVKERKKTGGRVEAAGREIEERKIPLSGVTVGIPSVRRWWG